MGFGVEQLVTQLSSLLVLVPEWQHTCSEGQSMCWSQLMGIDGTKAGGAGQLGLLTQLRLLSVPSNSEQHRAPSPVWHVVPPQTTVGDAQKPCPSHAPPCSHCVSEGRNPQSDSVRHWPLPSQTPVVFVVLSTQLSSKRLQETVGQVASVAVPRQMPVPAQVAQTPVQAWLQQTPSAQELLAHSALLVHGVPTVLFGAEQLPASSHRLVALQTCPIARGVPPHSWLLEPQRPATHRLLVTLAGKSRHVLSAGQAIAPQASSSGSASHAAPVGAQRRHGPSHTAVQQTLPPSAVG
jgi:hypothetical protein